MGRLSRMAQKNRQVSNAAAVERQRVRDLAKTKQQQRVLEEQRKEEEQRLRREEEEKVKKATEERLRKEAEDAMKKEQERQLLQQEHQHLQQEHQLLQQEHRRLQQEVQEKKLYDEEIQRRKKAEDQATMSSISIDATKKFEGRRIISCKSLEDALSSVSSHGRICKESEVKFLHESQTSLAVDVIFQCSCGWLVHVRSDSGEEEYPLNKAMALASINAPIGFDDSVTFFTCLDVPSPTKHTFLKEQRSMTTTLRQVVEKNLEEAVKEEVELAIEANQFVNVGGIVMPWVKCVVDGGWVIRSHGHSYTSNYGHAAIIGARTHKVLYIGWRQKVCKLCTLHKNKGSVPPEHICYKNWDKASTAMEADIIKDGFAETIMKHHFVYSCFVGDGDSSVHSAVRDIYEVPNFQVEKIECINHVIRNFNTKLALLSGPSNNTKFKVTQDERRNQIVKEEVSVAGKRLREYCLFFNSLGATPENSKRLQKAILSISKHTFGNHLDCEPDLCKNSGTEDPDYSRTYSQFAIFEGLNDVLKRPAALASSLIHCGTSNIVESFMNVVAKFVEGKRKNLGGMSLYATKILSATLSFNTNSFIAAQVSEVTRCRPPNPLWISVRERARKRRLQQRTYSCSKKRKVIFHWLTSRNSRGDKDYGDNPTKPDINEEDLHGLVQAQWASLQVNEEMQKEIMEETACQADSALWYKHRKFRITASNAGKIFKLQDKNSNLSTLKTLLGDQKLTGKAKIYTDYGKANEENARRAYEMEFPQSGPVRTCGLIISLDDGIFGASPDGLVGDSGLLEIKCPASIRDIDPKQWPVLRKSAHCPLQKLKDSNNVCLKRTHDHFYQVVTQIIVSKKDFCDYYVWTPHGTFSERIMKAEAEKVWSKLEPKLKQFWQEDMAPEIVDSRIARQSKSRIPTYRLDAMNNKAVKSKFKNPKQTETNF